MYQIRYFLAVCETLNFTRASEKCFVSQPSLTKAIQKLEDNLGGRLFDRTKNSVQLTDLGRVMQPHLGQLYSAARQAREQAKSFLTAQHARLNLGIMCTVCLEPLIGMLAEFQMSYPKIELHILEGTLEQLNDALDKGEIDIGVMASPYEFPKRFDTIPLYRENYVVACAANHRLLAKKHITLTDLQGERYVSRENCEYSDYIDDRLNELSVEVEVRHATEREDWIQSMVRAGFGVSFIPENTCTAAGLSFCTVSEPAIQRDVQILTLAAKEKPAPLQAFIDQATQYDWRSASESLKTQVA